MHLLTNLTSYLEIKVQVTFILLQIANDVVVQALRGKIVQICLQA